jgi:hypothetical protein
LPLAKRAAMLRVYVPFGEPVGGAFPFASLASPPGVTSDVVSLASSRTAAVQRVETPRDLISQAAGVVAREATRQANRRTKWSVEMARLAPRPWGNLAGASWSRQSRKT